MDAKTYIHNNFSSRRASKPKETANASFMALLKEVEELQDLSDSMRKEFRSAKFKTTITWDDEKETTHHDFTFHSFTDDYTGCYTLVHKDTGSDMSVNRVTLYFYLRYSSLKFLQEHEDGCTTFTDDIPNIKEVRVELA